MGRSKGELKKGFTTGTCAQAAAKGACLMLVGRRLLKMVEVETACGIRLMLKLIDQKIKKESALCGVIKDAGDDPDITHGVKIYAEVKFSSKKGISIIGGEGVGRVTRPGLAVGVGEYAINPVPRRMIMKELSGYLPKDRGLEVIISIPRGKELAKQTFNPRLGIIDGISVIGTTGIVEPKSTEAYKASLSLQLDMLIAEGHKRVVLVLGYVGERFAKDVFDDLVIKIGDHIGFMLKECLNKGIEEIFLIGHIGKLVKMAQGQLNTHSKYGDNRIEAIAGYARDYGAKRDVVEELLGLSTAEAAIDILKRNNLMGVFVKIAQDVVRVGRGILGHKPRFNCMLLSLKGEILASKTSH